MKESPLDFDYDFEIPDFDRLLDDLDLDLPDDLSLNCERTERRPPVEDC